MEETGGFVNKYICALSVYLMINVSLILNVSIDKEIGDPGNGKYVVYGLNARDKGYPMEKLGYQNVLPKLVKALVYFILTLIKQLLVLYNNANIF